MTERATLLEQELKDAKQRHEVALGQMQEEDGLIVVPSEGSQVWEEIQSTGDEVIQLQRELAKERKEPYAVPCDFPVSWSIGAPLPFLFCSDYQTILTFYVEVIDPDWDGKTMRMVDPASGDKESLCLVNFNQCESAKLGHPNDEVHRGHPLADRGLESYTAQIVKNSPWLREVASTNSAHMSDNPAHWESLNHYVFWFHDTTFECLAQSYEIELSEESMASMFDKVKRKMLRE